MNRYDNEGRSSQTWRSTLVAIARLVRFPNLFTAPPDVVLGASIVVGLGHSVSLGSIVALSFASVMLYAAGTTLNDYFDAAEDARQRPERPIPSGDVSRIQALGLGIVLLSGGIVTAWAAAGANAGLIATVLGLLILSYDGVFKGTVVGYLAMGGNRGMNVLLGTSAVLLPTALPWWALSIPIVISLYIASITYMAESETGDGGHLTVSAAIAGLVIACCGVIGILIIQSPALVDSIVAMSLLASFIVWTGRPLRAAYIDPSPGTIGPAVGACVLGLVMLNAAFAATTSWIWAIGAILFIIPAIKLAGVFDVT